MRQAALSKLLIPSASLQNLGTCNNFCSSVTCFDKLFSNDMSYLTCIGTRIYHPLQLHTRLCLNDLTIKFTLNILKNKDRSMHLMASLQKQTNKKRLRMLLPKDWQTKPFVVSINKTAFFINFELCSCSLDLFCLYIVCNHGRWHFGYVVLSLLMPLRPSALTFQIVISYMIIIRCL